MRKATSPLRPMVIRSPDRRGSWLTVDHEPGPHQLSHDTVRWVRTRGLTRTASVVRARVHRFRERLPAAGRVIESAAMHPLLQALADRRLGVLTAREALDVGYEVDDIKVALARRQWIRLRKGVYATAESVARSDDRGRHCSTAWPSC